MEWKNDEMSVSCREPDLIIVRVNEGVKKLTIAAAEECAAKMKEIIKLSETPKVIFFYIPEMYVSKDTIRCYANTVFGEAGVAVFCKSFAAWLIGNIAVTIRQRFMSSNPASGAPIKAFKKEEEAIEWSLNQIKNAIS